jgi:serine/threonine-protein kinase PRP4
MASPASSDEGEIRDSVLEKATTSLPQLDGSLVDRQDRNRSRYSKSNSQSPENGSASRGRRSADRSRSPYSNRGPRGSKRARDDDHYDRTDPRRFRVHYEDRHMDGRRRVRSSYEDLDKGPSSSTDLRYDDRDRYVEKRARTRSRSPYQAPRGEYRRDHGGHSYQDRNRYRAYADSDRNSTYGYDDQSSRSSRNQSVSKRADGQVPSDVTKREAKSTQGHSQLNNGLSVNGFNIEKYLFLGHPLPRSLLTLPRPSDTPTESANEPEEREELDESALIEQRRKRREAIKAKYKGATTPLLVQALQLGDKSTSATLGRSQGDDDVRSTRSGKLLIF